MKKRMLVLFLLVCTIVLFASSSKSSENVTDFAVTPETIGDIAVISFQCHSEVHLIIEILNNEGVLVATIASNFFNVGDYALEWNRTNFSGNFLQAGDYVIQVKENKRFVTKRKTLILK